MILIFVQSIWLFYFLIISRPCLYISRTQMEMEVFQRLQEVGGQFVLITHNDIHFCTQHLSVLFSHNFYTLYIYFKDIHDDGGFLEVWEEGEAVSQFIITCNGIEFCTHHLAVLFSHNFQTLSIYFKDIDGDGGCFIGCRRRRVRWLVCFNHM